MNAGTVTCGRPAGHRADDLDALGLPVQQGGGDNGDDDDDERAGELAIHAPDDEQHDHGDGADREGEQVRFVEAGDELDDLLEELVALERDAEHLAQLAADDDQRRAEDVADQDRLGQQVGDEAQLRNTGEQRHDADEERQQRGERGVACGVAARQRCDRRCRHDRGRRLGAHDDLLGGAKQRIHHQGAQGDIQARDWGDPGQVAVGHRRRHEHRKHRDGHDEFGAEQRGTEASEKGQAGNEPRNAGGGRE